MIEIPFVRKLNVTGNGRSYCITIPVEFIRHHKWKKGEKKVLILEQDGIKIKDWKEE